MNSKTITLKEINKLAIPAIIAGIAEPLIGLADTAIVGHIGKTELAAVGLGSSLFLLFIWGFSSIKSAISSLVANYLGRNELSKIKTLVPQAILISVSIGLVLLTTTYIFSKELFVFHNAKGEVLENALKYYKIRAFGFPLTLATFTIFGVFRGCQNTSWAMIISIFGGVLNIILDFALIYGTPFSSSFGIEGAAIATLIAQVVMFLFAIVILKTKYAYSFSFALKLNHEFKSLLQITGNLIIRTLALNIAYDLANYFSLKYGESQMAAHTIAMNIWLFSAFFIDGYANAGNAIAGKLFGSGDNVTLRNVGLKIAKISTLIGAILGLIYFVSSSIIGSFFTTDQEVLKIFKIIFIFVILSQPINGIAFALDGIFKGLGRASLLRNTLLLGTFFIFVPIIFYLDYLKLEMLSVWVAFLVWMLFRSGSLLYVFLRDFKN